MIVSPSIGPSNIQPIHDSVVQVYTSIRRSTSHSVVESMYRNVSSDLISARPIFRTTSPCWVFSAQPRSVSLLDPPSDVHRSPHCPLPQILEQLSGQYKRTMSIVRMDVLHTPHASFVSSHPSSVRDRGRRQSKDNAFSRARLVRARCGKREGRGHRHHLGV